MLHLNPLPRRGGEILLARPVIAGKVSQSVSDLSRQIHEIQTKIRVQ